MAVGVGDLAPEFTATGTGANDNPPREYKLSDCRGEVVLLVFYPGDATPVCTKQLSSYDSDFSRFEALGVKVWALSPQDIDSHEAFSQAHGGFKFPLLYDEGGEIARSYSVLGPLGFYRRSIFVVDAQGVIQYAKRSTAGLTYVSSDDLLRELERIAL